MVVDGPWYVALDAMSADDRAVICADLLREVTGGPDDMARTATTSLITSSSIRRQDRRRRIRRARRAGPTTAVPDDGA